MNKRGEVAELEDAVSGAEPRVVRTQLLVGFLCAAIAGVSFGGDRAAPATIPDLTKGEAKDDKHDWNLGPTGARGWIWGRGLETIGAKQILITAIEKGSPSDGVLAVGDVILGVGGEAFVADARKEFGHAITEAEREESGGKLKLIRWRSGKEDGVTVTLPVMGTYAATSPFDCPKARKIADAACRSIAETMKRAKRRDTGVKGLVNVLALLASGDEHYMPIVRDYVHALAKPDVVQKNISDVRMAAWRWGYTGLLLSEYHLATNDPIALPAIEKYAIGLAEGQSAVGTWGHGIARPADNGGRLHGRLGGYGALNQAGLVCHLSLVLAEKCGVRNSEVRQAIERANAFAGFFTHKGAIPYGDHRPNWEQHDDNGKCSIAAIIFDLQGMKEETHFFSKMAVASYGEREGGHTGNYFSFLWGAMGANRAGPEAAAAFMHELAWFYDLGRTTSGSFPYQGGAGMSGTEHVYAGWDCTGAFALAYMLPHKKLFITGHGVDTTNALVGSDLAAVMEAGRGFTRSDKGLPRHREMTEAQLLESLASWSPAVRSRASRVVAEKQDASYVPVLLALLRSKNLDSQYGACSALGALKDLAAPAVPKLAEALEADDLWLRVQAAYALAMIGPAARPMAPELLHAAARIDKEDPRHMMQKFMAFALFDGSGGEGVRGLLSGDLKGIDREALREVMTAILDNPDGRARSTVGGLYYRLSLDELRPMLPAIVLAIKEQAPSGEMFSDGIRIEGLKLLARHRIAEGIPLCLEILELDRWGKQARIRGSMRALETYGGAAKSILPALEELKQQLLVHREAKTMQNEIAMVQPTIDKIANDKKPPKLVSLADLR